MTYKHKGCMWCKRLSYIQKGSVCPDCELRSKSSESPIDILGVLVLIGLIIILLVFG